MNKLESTLGGFAALSSEHISAYQLSVEDGSALASMIARGNMRNSLMMNAGSSMNLSVAVLRPQGTSITRFPTGPNRESVPCTILHIGNGFRM